MTIPRHIFKWMHREFLAREWAVETKEKNDHLDHDPGLQERINELSNNVFSKIM